MPQQAFGWPRTSMRRSRTVAIALVLALNATGAGAASAADPTANAAPSLAPAERSSVGLADGRLREVVERFEAQLAPARDVEVREGRALVEVIYTGAKDDAERAIERLGGEVNGYAGTTLLQALVPIGKLTRLERAAWVTELRAPLLANEPQMGREANETAALSPAATTGQAVSKTNAAAWHAANITGAGVKIGIIDSFNQATWNAALDRGRSPGGVRDLLQLQRGRHAISSLSSSLCMALPSPRSSTRWRPGPRSTSPHPVSPHQICKRPSITSPAKA